MSIRIGSIAPDFEADSTQGRIRFHQWIGDSWCVLFSHPKDFTPVCTTELGYMARLKPEFDRRNCKIAGLSVDRVEDHTRWLQDIKEVTGSAPDYPLIGDPELRIAKLYEMLPEAAGSSSSGRTPADNQTVRTVFVIAPDKTIKAMFSYPMTTGHNFDEVLRLLDSCQLTAKRARDDDVLGSTGSALTGRPGKVGGKRQDSGSVRKLFAQKPLTHPADGVELGLEAQSLLRFVALVRAARGVALRLRHLGHVHDRGHVLASCTLDGDLIDVAARQVVVALHRVQVVPSAAVGPLEAPQHRGDRALRRLQLGGHRDAVTVVPDRNNQGHLQDTCGIQDAIIDADQLQPLKNNAAPGNGLVARRCAARPGQARGRRVATEAAGRVEVDLEKGGPGLGPPKGGTSAG